MEKRTLYDIETAILNCIDEETGEIFDFQQLEELQMERDAKIENIALYIKDLEADAKAIKAEEYALAERRKAKENRSARLREYLAQTLDGAKFETARVQLSFRASTKCEITDAVSCLEYLEKNDFEKCIKYKEPELSKSEITKLLKAGETIPGAVLTENQNLQMK